MPKADKELVETSRKIFLDVQFGQSRDQVAKRVGLGSGKSYEKAAKVVEEIYQSVLSGRFALAKALRSVLNHQSIDGAYKLTQKPTAESDPILESIARGEVRTSKQAQSLLKNQQRLKERSLNNPLNSDNGGNSSNLLKAAAHLRLEPGGLVQIYVPECSEWHQRHARIESVGEKQCKVWKRNIKTMEMELCSFPHADLTPLSFKEVPELFEINSRIQALYTQGSLDPFERQILQLLERCVTLSPVELDYLNLIELKYQQEPRSNSLSPDITPQKKH